METVLIVGASGRVGVSAVLAALWTSRQVLAVVRNQTSAENLFKHVGTREGMTTVEADVLAEDGVKGVVDRVRAGELPAFQHVYSCVGRMYAVSPVQSLDMATYQECMHVNLTANIYTYRATIPYLLSLPDCIPSYTQVTGASADSGLISITGISQGGLVSLINAAILENKDSNIRVNEVYLSYLVQYDAEADKVKIPMLKSSEFAKIYEEILEKPEIDGCRVSVYGPRDVDRMNFMKKITHQYTNESVKDLYEAM